LFSDFQFFGFCSLLSLFVGMDLLDLKLPSIDGTLNKFHLCIHGIQLCLHLLQLISVALPSYQHFLSHMSYILVYRFVVLDGIAQESKMVLPFSL
jgi:hypothetical protein